MRVVELIEKKQHGKALTKQEIDFLIKGYTEETIPDYQMSALLMAIYFKDMTPDERLWLTRAMVKSGDTIDLSKINGVKVDKHSTGGVADTTTLVLGPLVASLGIPVAKMSGRGLGHTGGTIDKLESIPGFHIELTTKEFIAHVNRDKIAIVGQTGNLTPADKKLYALRDVTATVGSIPLIASSIMSKKIAAGSDAICLDVKVGSGAFMKTPEEARKLAEAMVQIGNDAGRKTVAVISDMSQPLGNAVGNALEVIEAIEVLKGKGPKALTDLVFELGAQMVVLAQKATTVAEAKQLLKEQITSGKALEQFQKLIKAQGGNEEVVTTYELLPQATYQFDLPATTSGYVNIKDAEQIGLAAMLLGAGRAVKDDEIDYGVGLVMHKRIGDHVTAGESLLTIYSNREDVSEVEDKLYGTIEIGEKPKLPPLIYDIVTTE